MGLENVLDQIESFETRSVHRENRGVEASPGLCEECAHMLRNETRKGTVYLRCGRAKWDDRLVRYPRLPVRECVGYEPAPDRS